MYSFEGNCQRIVIPKELRHQIVTNLHAANQGTTSMLARARQTVYWPGMDRDINNHVSSCHQCRTHAPSLPQEPLISTEIPDYPFQRVATDLFDIDSYTYLVYVDRLTGFIELAHFPNSTSTLSIINTLREFFHRWGVPEQISLDGGPNLTLS